MDSSGWRSLYPFASHWLSLAAGRYHYLDEGQGRPLLMLHGNPTWSFYWRRLVQRFADRFRTVVPDHLGCGWSDKPLDFGYTLQDHIDNVVSLIERLDLRDVTLIGHDWGGPIGVGAALLRPDRFSRLVLLNTGVFPPPYIPWRIRACRLPGLGRLAVQGLNLFSYAALWMAVAQPGCLSPAVRAGLLAPYARWPERIGVYGFVRDIPGSARHPTWHTLAEIEAGLSTLSDRPSLLIWGMRDWCFRRECLDRLVGLLPKAQVVRCEQAGHWVVEEAPEEVCRALESFLGRPG